MVFFVAPQRHDCVFNEGLQSHPPPCAFCVLFRCSEAATSNLAPLQMARAFVMFGIQSLYPTAVNLEHT